MIIDAHYHLEERIETMDSLLEQMDRHGISRVALIPTPVAPFQVERVAEKASAVMRRALVGRWRGLGLLMYRTTVTAGGNFSALGKTYPIYDVPDNESVAQAMQAHPDRFYGWLFVNPGAADPIAELEKWNGEPGWIGVKSHPFWHRYPVAMLDEVAAYCDEQSWPLLVHLGGDQESGDYQYLPERHPNLKVLYAHAGVPFYHEVWDYAKGKENLFVDLSSPHYVDERVRLGALKALGAERCLHGTDGPYGHFGQGRMVQAILRLPLSDTEKERVLGGSFIELINA